MKRFFYTDPLAAAWQAKHHGMRFQNINNGVEYGLPEILTHAATGNFCHMNIHPDSIHLLEPNIGDVLLNPDNRAATAIPNRDKGADYNCIRIGGAVSFVKNGSAAIIHRNGIAFHHPESEDA